MASYLRKMNYIVVNQEYPTTRRSIKELAARDVVSMVEECQKQTPEKIHFITHSIGGIVLRAYVQDYNLQNLGRIVMLAPPNHGSPLADLLHHNLLFKMIAGPAGQELTTDHLSTPNRLNPWMKTEMGVIAGTFSFMPFMKLFFHEDNDGKVPVSSTRIAGMNDFIALPVSHMFMMQNKTVMKEAVYFLQHGTFNKPTMVSSI
jgi:pimeloyl-ACP methyl ester carboxylesterase